MPAVDDLRSGRRRSQGPGVDGRYQSGHLLSESQQGFTREPQQTFRLDPRPCVVWTAQLGKPAGSLLVMTSDGVTELCFTNRKRSSCQLANHPAIHDRSGGSGRRGRNVPFVVGGKHKHDVSSVVGQDGPRLAVAAGAGGGRTSGLVHPPSRSERDYGGRANIATSGIRHKSSARPSIPASGRQWPIPDIPRRLNST